MSGSAPTLLERLLKGEISVEEFYQLAEQLSDGELKLLSELMREKHAQKQRRPASPNKTRPD
jgi:hypothetical protein